MAILVEPQSGLNVSAADLASRLEKITEQLQKEVSRLAMLEPVSAAEKQLAVLRDELDGIGHLIAETRNEIAGLQPSGFAHSHLVSASDELDAVVGATERAAVEIMVAAERAQEAAQRMRSLPDMTPQALRDLDIIETAALDIFMACSFQDLTGQRIRKVVGALTYIEKRVMALTLLWQVAPGQEPGTAPQMDVRADAHLLNGPSDSGLMQTDIDLLLHGNVGAGSVGQDDVDALFS
ncbi:MAG TPA: protein phosphatase CheZ [Rhodopila sp.]|nr:protein phosphatase CheZ [Rhodopila sp.]